MKRPGWIGALLTVAVFFQSLSLFAQGAALPEYQVKAVFLYNFTKFVQWPDNMFAHASDPIVIVILGADPFGEFLDQTVKGEAIDGHPVVVKRFQNLKDVGLCHILFVAGSDAQYPGLKDPRLRNSLVVGDSPSFASNGGMVGLLTENNKTRIQINLKNVKEADLVISSRLLRLAEVVDNVN